MARNKIVSEYEFVIIFFVEAGGRHWKDNEI